MNLTADTIADDLPLAIVEPGDASWHDGPGWYYWDHEYRDEGSVGAFPSSDEAVRHAADAGYRVKIREASK